MKQARQPWRLPQVTPAAARRRRVFFGLLAAIVAAPVLASVAQAVTHDTGMLTAARGRPTLVMTGCTLAVQGHDVELSDPLAMTLTDVAGADQNAGASLAHTAAAVARAWPREAGQASSVAKALRGYLAGALACTATLPTASRQPMGADGLTARANQMWDSVKRVFGPLPAGGFMPGGVHTGHVPGSAHYEGRAIDFLYRPVTSRSLRHGWVLAQWLEAHAAELQVATVIFDRQIWTPGPWAARQWRPYVYPDGTTTNPTLLHDDHVHVDVQRGS
jgi:hypothetical protein